MAPDDASDEPDGPQGLRRAVDPIAEFLHDEAAGGIALLVATIAALLWANLGSPGGYASFWGRELTLGDGSLAITEDLRHWVNDGLMVIFFFVVGLEIKREFAVGQLRDRRAATLPVMAAVGGVALPTAIFLALTAGGEEATGWAIPAATDIAFAVGVLALFGSRVSPGLRLLLLTIAIVDDVIAITIIAVFYTHHVSIAWLAAAIAVLGGVVLLRRVGVTSIAVYVLVGVVAWVAMLESGVHATIAGVALGLLTPAGPVDGRPVLERLEHRLHPLSAFVIVPLFALANAGLDFRGGVLRDAVQERLAWAVVAGLVIGKLLGISGGTFLGLRLGWGTLPDDVRRSQIWSIAALGGIGFTVSLFIAQIAFTGAALENAAKVGIFAGSILSAALGTALLLRRPAASRRSGP